MNQTSYHVKIFHYNFIGTTEENIYGMSKMNYQGGPDQTWRVSKRFTNEVSFK
jgi:hypothetical protein